MTAPPPMKLTTLSALPVGDIHTDAGWLKSVVLPTLFSMRVYSQI